MIHKNPQLVLVVWVDSQSDEYRLHSTTTDESNWFELKKLDEIKKLEKLPAIDSVGYLVSSNKNVISLVANYDRTNGMVCGRMDIPVMAIVQITKLNGNGKDITKQITGHEKGKI